MNDFTFNLLKIVVSVVAALLAVYLIPYIRNKLKDDKYAQLLAIVEIAVRAAEQTIKGSGQGVVKKEEVMVFVTGWMNDHGFIISQSQLSQLIEAAVFNMNKGIN